MAEFINTVDVIGDEALATLIIDRSVAECIDNSVTAIGDYAFHGCSKLTTAYFPAAMSIGENAFRECSQLPSLDFPVATSMTGWTFYGCSKLAVFILRSKMVCTMGDANAFNSTPIKSGAGYIYVPRDLVESYKSATNWSKLASQFRDLESYTVDGTTTGELDPNKI